MNISNTENFKIKADEIHLKKYNYSLVNYVNQKIKVKIVCPIHGEFEQTPKSHLQGKGCLLCGRNEMKTKLTKNEDLFTFNAKKTHNNKYDYSLIKYKGSHVKIKIICPIHGEFEQTPSNHLKGHGCTYCTYNNSNLEKFIENGQKTHNNKYDYSLVKYRNNKTKVKIICPTHGEFEQSPDHHINRKHGCPSCKESKGEYKIREILTENNIKFIPQYKFNECKNKLELPFDFFLPDYNTCIEFNGIQHYKPVKYFGGEEKLKEQQINDKIKKDFCEDHDIKLVIIRYNESVEDKLKNLC